MSEAHFEPWQFQTDMLFNKVLSIIFDTCSEEETGKFLTENFIHASFWWLENFGMSGMEDFIHENLGQKILESIKFSTIKKQAV